jgi:clan AA aspartic protease (TIGR02281 family)
MLRASLTASACLLASFATTAALSAEFDTAVPLQEKGVATYYVSADFDGRALDDFLVDTGSGYVSISEKTLKTLRDLGRVEYLRKSTGVMADGTEISVPVYRIASMRIGSCDVRDVEAVVFAGADHQILGLSALKKVAPFALSVEPPKLMLSHCQDAPASLVMQAN